MDEPKYLATQKQYKLCSTINQSLKVKLSQI